jgi:hypothetical protein
VSFRLLYVRVHVDHPDLPHAVESSLTLAIATPVLAHGWGGRPSALGDVGAARILDPDQQVGSDVALTGERGQVGAQHLGVGAAKADVATMTVFCE